MANVLSLALRVTADATGLKLTPVERALKGLGDQADKLSEQFAKFSGDSDAAAAAQERFSKQSQDLINTLRSGGPEAAAKFAAEFEKLAAAADKEAAAFERAAKITEANLSNFERFTRTQRELKEQVDAGRISQETYNRAIEGAAKGLTDAERGAAGLGARTKEINAAADGSALKFNELSGIFAVLPGPLGNIAGRLSGISSASEGLSRIFAGGLGQGVSAIGASFTALLNPLTLALGSVAAFGAAAVSITRGLVDLESRVKGLGAAADQLGVSFETIQVLEEAASRAGTSVEAAAAGIQKFAARIDAARSGTGAAAEAFRELGISQEQLANTAPTELAALVAEELGKIEDPAKRAALQIALLGKSGEELRRTFSEIPGATDDLRKFSAVISEQDRARIESLGPAFDGIGVALRGLGQSILTPFAGLVAGVADALANAIGAVTNSIGPILEQLSPVLDAVGARFSAFGESLFAASQQATTALQPLVSVFEFFSGIVQAALPGIIAAFESLFAVVARLTTVFLDSFSAIVNVVGEVFAAFTNLLGFSEATDFATVIGEGYNFVYQSISQVITVIGTVLEVINRFATIVVVAIGQAVTTFLNFAASVSEFLGVGAALQAIGSVIAGVFGSVAGVFSTIANAIGGVVGRLLGIAERFLGIDRSAKEAAASTNAIAAATDSLNGKSAVAVEQAEKIAAADEARQKELQRQIENVDKLIEASERQQRIANEFGGSDQRFQAAENLAAIENEIARVEEQQRIARAAGDTAATDAATARLASLDQVAARERDIASGAAEEREAAAKAADDLTKKLFAEAQKRANAEVAAREKIEQAQAAFRERQFEVDLARLEELNTVRTGAVEVSDIRSGGIGAFFATLQEDPAVSEAKKQTAELTKLNKNIEKLEAQRVDILAGTG